MKNLTSSEWWDRLRNTNFANKDKGYYTNLYFPLRMWQYLTNQEIEYIYLQELKQLTK